MMLRTGHGNKNTRGFNPLNPPLAPPLHPCLWSIIFIPVIKTIRETRFEVPLWMKWSQNALWSPALNEMIAKRALKSRSEWNDRKTRFEGNALWSPALNEMIAKRALKETRFEVPLWMKWSLNALWSPALNEMIAKRALKSRSEWNDR